MQTVLIIVQLIVSVALVIVVLLQKSEGGALGIGGGGGGAGGLFSPRGAGDALTRTTAILAVLFFATSMGLVLLALHGRPQTSILDSSPTQPVTAPITKKPGAPNPNKPATPEVPGVPSPQH